MRALFCVALIAAACAPGEKRAADPTAEKYAGTWEGRSYRSSSDSGVPFRTVMALGEDGSLRGTLMYPGRRLPPVPIRVREYSDTSLVQELGPYHSLVANREVVARAVGQVKGDSLSGTFEMRPPSGGDVIMTGTFWAKKES